MSKKPTIARVGLLTSALLIPVTLAACSSGSSSTTTTPAAGGAADSATTSSSASASPMDSSMPMESGAAGAMAPFGAACSAVPASGAGSFNGMSTAPVATAASANPVLSTLVTAVKAAGLVDTLNSAPALTVFAPSNDAFTKLPAATLKAALADPKGLLTKVLTYHVISGKISPDKLAGTHKTLEGQDVTVTGSGDSFTVEGTRMVVCGNVQTANATVYIVDGVLLPPAAS